MDTPENTLFERAWRISVIGLMALVGALTGMVIGCTGLFPKAPRADWQATTYPLPHHIPKYPGGTSLRFAMVQDVIHERFPRHGKAYYLERNRRTREALEGLRKQLRPGERPPEKYFALLDDLGAGLELLGQSEKAVRVLRDKRAEQEKYGINGREMYSTYANLGTFLIHAGFPQAQRGEAKGKERMKEGLALIHESIKVNPQAHFGREAWQAVAVAFFLAALDDPGLLLRYDMVGNRLDAEIDPGSRRCLKLKSGDPNAITPWGFDGSNRDAKDYLEGKPVRKVERFRKQIALVGAEDDWADRVKGTHREPVPFDEPTLGIIGMWRAGGGANPHFALALGEIMLRVGQRYIAWDAYERAVLLAGRFWPDAQLQKKFVDHCRRRQAVIEKQLSDKARERLRPAFEAELAHGQQYQAAYQAYEAEQIAAGADIESPNFYDAFHAKHGPIASPVGEEDKFIVAHIPFLPRINVHAILLFAGLFAFVTAVVLRLRSRPSQAQPLT